MAPSSEDPPPPTTSGEVPVDSLQQAPVLLNVEDAAQYIGRNVAFMRRVVARREIAHHKPGRAVRFDTRDLDAYLAACRVEPLGR